MGKTIIESAAIGYLKIFKDDFKNKSAFQDYKNLTNATVEREDTNDEFITFKTFKNMNSLDSVKFYQIKQYDMYFNEHFANFGMFDDLSTAIEAMKNGFERIYPGFIKDVYKNGDNQWLTDEHGFGVHIVEYAIDNTFGEV
jgi:hypothetical protein